MCATKGGRVPKIHFDIPKVKVMVREEFLHDFKEGHGLRKEAELISISSYPTHAPTFTALIEGTYLFHYLPITAFTTRNAAYPIPIPLLQATPFNCPSGELTVGKFSELDHCQVYGKTRQLLGYGRYQMTFDWYNDNELCHLVALESGTLILAPSHKLAFNTTTEDGLPGFSKLHATWRV